MKRFLTIFSLIFFAAAQSYANHYFSAYSIAPKLLEGPYRKGSEEWKNEVAQIIKIQKKVTPEDIKAAEEERNLRPEHLVLAIDPTMTREKFPKLYHLLDRVGDTSKDVTENVKNYWNEKRPYLSDEKVKALIPAHDNPSYPSGHTTGSYLYAHVMGLLLPPKLNQFYVRAEAISQHRVMVGMHYPHDLVGGKQLAFLLVGGMIQNDAFQKDFAAAQKELAQN